MPQHIYFYIGLAFLFTHELDAIRCSEWRIVPVLSKLNDRLGRKIFIIAHIPIFIFLFIGITGINKLTYIYCLNLFFIIHFFLHLLFMNHQNNGFKDWISWTIIIGAAAFGVIDLIVFRPTTT